MCSGRFIIGLAFFFLPLVTYSKLATLECLMAILIILQWHSDIYSIVLAETRSVVPWSQTETWGINYYCCLSFLSFCMTFTYSWVHCSPSYYWCTCYEFNLLISKPFAFLIIIIIICIKCLHFFQFIIRMHSSMMSLSKVVSALFEMYVTVWLMCNNLIFRSLFHNV